MQRPFRLGPRQLDDAIDRPRLLTLLRGRFDVAVTTVVGGPGFGKSTLLAQALRDNVVQPQGVDRWLSLDGEDALVTNLTAGLAGCAGADLSQVDGPDALVSLLVADAPAGVCLVLDDVHLVPEGSPGAEFLVELVRTPRPGLSFLLSSRRPVPGLARLRAQGHVVDIDEPMLSFSEDEALRVSASHAGTLGGWPAMLVLAERFGERSAADFATEEVVDRLDAPTRQALAALAAVGGGDAELAAAAVGRPVDLTQLADLPLVVVDGDHVVPHALWSELLEGVLDPDDTRLAQQRVGHVLLGRDDPIRAGAVFLATGELDGLRAAVRSACSGGFMATPADVLDSWSGALDGDSPESHLLSAVLGRAREPFADTTRDAVEAAVVAARSTGDVGMEVTALWEFGFVARARGELAAMLAHIPRVIELDAMREPAAAPLAGIAQAMVADVMGDVATAAEHLAGIDRDAVSPGWRAPVEFMSMVCAYYQGDAERTRVFANEFLRAAPVEFPGRRFVAPWVDWLEGATPTDWSSVPDPGSMPGSNASDRLWSGSSLGVMFAYSDLTERARASVDVATEESATALLAQHQTMVVAASAALAATCGDEDGARRQLDALIGSAADLSVVERSMRLALAIGYVLVPELRDLWDRTELGSLHEPTRRLARAVVDRRDGHLDPSILRSVEMERVATALPLAWSVDLACWIHRVDPRRAREMTEVLANRHGDRVRTRLRDAATSTDAPVAEGASRLLATVPFGSTPIELRVLGPTELVVNGVVCEGGDWRRGRVRELVCLLAHHRRVGREQAAAALWPDLDDTAARRNLRVTLNYLQGVLEPDRQPGEAAFYLRQEGERLELSADPHVVIDAERFQEELDRATRLLDDGQLSDALVWLDRALARSRGRYLDDVAVQEWAIRPSERLQMTVTDARLSQSTIRLALGDTGGALDAANAALDTDPWSEPAHRMIIAAHLARGDRGAALRAVQQCREMLDDLGVTPSPETTALERRLERLDGEPG